MSTIIPEEKHRQIMQTCTDVPEESPSFPMPLSRVGISGKTVWVRLAANRGGHLPFSAAIFVDLAGDRRGIHMSRMEQVVTSLYDREFTSLPEYAGELGAAVGSALKARDVSLELTGSLPLIQQAPVSKLASIDAVEVLCHVASVRHESAWSSRMTVGAALHHITACPCTLSYNKALFNRGNDPWPQATHSQRSKTRLSVCPPADGQIPTYRDLTDILSSVLHISQDLLKRPDETELVLKAHANPQFAEDAVRRVARAAGKKFKDILPLETLIRVESRSLESIHIHDVECSLETKLGDILAIQQSVIQE